jgi:hypothetical protein
LGCCGKKEHAILPTQRLKIVISGSRSVKQLPAKAIARIENIV